MAGSDKRVEVLEDELKLLKGEVKRTLVDLRAFIMREDSPLNERLSFAATAAPPAPTPTNETVVKERMENTSKVEALQEELNALKKEKAESSSPPAQDNSALEALREEMNALRKEKTASSSPSIQDNRALEALQEELKSQRRDRQDSGMAPQPAYQPPPGQGNWAATGYGPAGSTPPAPAPQPMESATSEHSQPTGRVSRTTEPDERGYQYEDEAERSSLEVRNSRSRPAYADEYEGSYGEDDAAEAANDPRQRRRYPEEASTGRQRRGYPEDSSPDPTERRRQNGMKDKVRPYGRENGHRWEYEEYEEDAWAAPRSGDGPSPRDRAVGTDSLDVNLVSNLLRWAYQAKRRLGPEGLMELLELYLRSGHHPRELRDVISFICSMVEEETTAYEADAAQD